MRFLREKTLGRFANVLCLSAAILVLTSVAGIAQSTPETQKTTIRIGHLWLGMPANGGESNFNPIGGFFPNDYSIAADRAQYAQAFTGCGIYLTATHWYNPLSDSLENVAVYAFVSDSLPNGRVVVPDTLTNYLRYNYPTQLQTGSNQGGPMLFGTYNPSYAGFQNHTFDEVASVTDSNELGVECRRTVYAWTQNYNNDYVITDLLFTNTGGDTLDSLYVNMQETGANMYFSNGSNPAGNFDPTMVWQHYYGGRPGDTARVFYEYSADNPKLSGDDMGAPQVSQNGRLINPNMLFYTILHASAQPYTDSSQDVDDPLEPKVTYMGVATAIPFNTASSIYGNKNFFAIRGGFSQNNPMSGAYSGTYHEINSDETGHAAYYNAPAGQYEGIPYMWSSFGPYKLYPGQKIHIVYASGFTGIGYKLGQKVGQEWLNGTLKDPPNASSIPGWNAETGLLPSNFKFPAGATSIDQTKDRWVSLGIDSVMKAAWRAKWNYEHNYDIPQAPPPPQTALFTVTSGAIKIQWSDPQAETMPNFDGYRIMRRVSSYDTVSYVPIYDSDSTDLAPVHTYYDSIAYYGAEVYYYIQAKVRIPSNDMNASPGTRGQIIYSSRALFPNMYYITPANFPQNDLSKIRVVPNPYNINDPELLRTPPFGLGLSTTNGRGITFYNLPAVCTIKIFTENGDLVVTHDHGATGNNTGSWTWNMLTMNQQLVYSGVYIAVFQTPNGEMSYQKFLIVQ